MDVIGDDLAHSVRDNAIQVIPGPEPSFEELTQIALALYPNLDRWAIETMVQAYMDGLLNEDGSLKKLEAEEEAEPAAEAEPEPAKDE